jgi:hypothetical protein
MLENIQNVSIEKKLFSIEDIEFWVKWLTRGKYKDIEGYQVEILKIGGPILIPNIHKLFNLVVKKGFPKPLDSKTHSTYF